MVEPFPGEKILESNLKYFEIHAAQRLTVFNFYVALSGTILAGIAAISQGSARFALAGAILGLLLVFMSFVFAKLDGRTAFLVKHAENVIKKIESAYLPEDLSVFELEDSITSDAQKSQRFPKKMYTYGQLFNAIFWIFGIIGFLSFIVMGLRAGGAVDWSEPKEKTPVINVFVKQPLVTTDMKNDPKSSADFNPRGSSSSPNNVGNVAGEANSSGKNKTNVIR